eukprot:jgi/Psemu1/255388/estExt_Genewise1Plus.C_1360020
MNNTIASEALAAAVGGAISSGVLYPLEVLKTRMQAEGDDHEDDMKTDRGTIDGEKNSSRMGVFFNGMKFSAIQSAIEKALYFFAYTALKRSYTYATTHKGTRQSYQKEQQLSAMASVLLGCLAEWVHLPITLPIDALTTAIQTSSESKNKKSKTKTKDMDRQKSHTVLALWMTLWKEKSFYNGIQAYWILCFKPALQYTTFEQVKAWILKLRSIQRGTKHQQYQPQNFDSSQAPAQLSAAEAFLLGMFSRTVATLVVFPFVRAKVRLQSLGKRGTGTESSLPSSVPTSPPPSQSIWKLLLENYTQGGRKALYQGLGPELARGVLSAALMMMVKERISGGVKKFSVSPTFLVTLVVVALTSRTISDRRTSNRRK